MAEIGNKLPPNPRKTKKARLSKHAKHLIAAMLERGLSTREAAKRLHLPNNAQLIRMRDGALSDTPAMKAEISRRKLKADLAWQKVFYGMNGEQCVPVVHKSIVLQKFCELQKFFEAL